jgi:hypothetical protein
MDLEWHTEATFLIGALDFYLGSFRCVKDSKNRKSEEKYAHDIIEVLRRNPDDWNEGLARDSATQLLFGVVPTHLCACYRLMSCGLQYEARILLRSLSEVLDLIEFFNHVRCNRKNLEKWILGEIVPNRITRDQATSLALGGDEYEIANEYREMPEAQNVTRLLRAKLYSARSGPVHHASDPLMQAARHRHAISIDTDLLADFNGELIRSCDYFLRYRGFALHEHEKTFRDLTRLLKGTLDDYIPGLVPKLAVTTDPMLAWADADSSPR